MTAALSPDDTLRRFYRWSLVVPVVVPLAAVLAGRVLGVGDTPGPVLMVGSILAFSLAIGGIPYALFAVLMAAYLGDKSAAECRKASYLAPLTYMPVQALYVIVIGGGQALLVFGGWALGFGYAYVVLVNVLRWLLQAKGVLPREPPAESPDVTDLSPPVIP